VGFLEARDSFYLGSVGDDGWPYVQHRGGPVGFLKVVGPAQIAWAERLGNRQYVTAGNVAGNDRVSIIAVDYPNRSRVKLYGHARFEPNPSAELLERFGFDGRMEGLVIVDVVAFDWNCPKYITPRYTVAEIEALTAQAAASGVSLAPAQATAREAANISGV